MNISLKTIDLDHKQGIIDCDDENLGKRKPFGAVNDSRIGSHSKSRRYKQLKI
jgi:hypothetical protein